MILIIGYFKLKKGDELRYATNVGLIAGGTGIMCCLFECTYCLCRNYSNASDYQGNS